MAGVLEGIRVLDLSEGIAGPMATMLLSDHGAEVTKIERPGGDPFRSQPGYRGILIKLLNGWRPGVLRGRFFRHNRGPDFNQSAVRGAVGNVSDTILVVEVQPVAGSGVGENSIDSG